MSPAATPRRACPQAKLLQTDRHVRPPIWQATTLTAVKYPCGTDKTERWMRTEWPTCSCYSKGTLALKPNYVKLINRLGRKTTPAADAPTYTCPRVKLLPEIDKTGRWIRSKRSTCSCCSQGTLSPQAKLHQTDRYIRSKNSTCRSSSHEHTEEHTERPTDGHAKGHTDGHRRTYWKGYTWRRSINGVEIHTEETYTHTEGTHMEGRRRIVFYKQLM